MASQHISPADRIRELSAINAEVAALVKDAGQAVNTLTSRPLDEADGGEDVEMADPGKSATLDERKAAFTAHTKAYYTGLQSVIAQLRRQAYALEEAGIIAAEAPTLSTAAQSRPAPSAPGRTGAQNSVTQDPEHITNGGLGNLDVGWLNSRGNKVGAEKENELMEEAKVMLENALNN